MLVIKWKCEQSPQSPFVLVGWKFKLSKDMENVIYIIEYGQHTCSI